MKFVEFSELGNPAAVLKLKEASSQALKTGEARVKVLASPIHPSNLLEISGHYGVVPPLPSIPGSEGIGEITEVGTDVAHLKVGMQVMLAGGKTWRDEIVGPAASFIPLPAGGDVEQMSMLTVNPLTAHLILKNFVDLKQGDWIIQSAANSAVGEFVIQLAAQRGIKTVNIVRRESLVADLKSLGADVVLVDGPDLLKHVFSAIDGAPIKMAIDAVGGETFVKLVDSLAFGGTAVAYGVLSMQPPTLNSKAVIFNDIRVRGFWLTKWFETASPEDKQAAFGHIIPLFKSGTIQAKIDSRFTLEDISKAVQRASEPGRNGKVLLMPHMS